MKIVIKLVSSSLLIAFLIGSLSIFGINIINKDIIEIVERENPKVQASLELEINIQEMADAVYDYSREENEETVIRFHDSLKDFKRFMDIYSAKIKSNEEKELIGKLSRKQKNMRILGKDIIETKKRVNIWRKKIAIDIEHIEDILENKLREAILKGGQQSRDKIESSLLMRIDIGRTFSAIEKYINDPQSRLIAEIEEAAKFEIEIKRYRRLPLSKEEKRWIAAIDKDYIETKKLVGELVQFERQQRRDINAFALLLKEADNMLDNEIRILGINKIADNKKRTLFNTNLITGAIFLSILLSIVISYFISLPIVNSIIKLRDALNRVGHGDLNVEIDIDSKDEIGELSESFNVMLQELKKSKEGMESIIKERTRELHRKVEELERFNKLAIGRELKMIELKKEIELFKSNTQ